MSAAQEAQAFLRFLTKEAKLPLAETIPRIGQLRKVKVNTAGDILTANPNDLQQVFTDAKELKQVINAARRVTNPKKRSLQEMSVTSKRAKTGDNSAPDGESELAFPVCNLTAEELESVTVETNRAPLFLAFTVVSLRYTRPEQPLSSCFSLAQAVVSAGAQSRAKYLGITSGPTAEEDGWAQGQPKLPIMGREVAVMRRQLPNQDIKAEEDDEKTQNVDVSNVSRVENHEAFWGLDLEALRNSNGPLIAGNTPRGRQQGPPIHLPQAARSYLLRSIVMVEQAESSDSKSTSKTKGKQTLSEREAGAAAVLRALEMVFDSWKSTLSSTELDKRAQSWYASVRPDVLPGKEGWGQRGQLQVRTIINLMKKERDIKDFIKHEPGDGS